MRDSADGTRTYGYDTFDQVTGATGGSQTSEAYGYDTNGNRTGSGVTVSAYNRVTNDGTYTYLYDNEGNRTRRTKTSTGEYELYVWDYRQRLVSVTLKNSAGDIQQTVVYEYDGLNRRIRRTVSNSAGTVTAKQRFLYDSNVLDGSTAEVVLVLDELASGLPYQQVDHRFMNGPLIDQVFADEGSGTGNQVLWYLSDAQNTVRDVAKYTNLTSGATAKIRNHLEYDAFGNVTSTDDPTTGGNPTDGDLPGLEGSGNEYSPQRSYTGREPDAATGLIYYRARWFDPKLGRFISEDPIGFAAGDANLNRYVGNSTPNATDPSGLYGIQIHFYTIYTILRSRGWSHEDAYQVAGWSQFVDDYSATTPWLGKTAWVTGADGATNYKNTSLMRQFHFWGCSETTPTSRNPDDLREQVEDAIAVLERGVEDEGIRHRHSVRLGVLLHTYADTWAHESFTAWKSSPLNERTKARTRPDIGHADAAESGNAPDNAYNDIEKAIEMAKTTYTLFPRRDDSKHVPWHVLEKELRTTLADVPANVRGKNWDEEKAVAAQTKASKGLILRLFGNDVTYNANDFMRNEAYFLCELEAELNAVRAEYDRSLIDDAN